MYAEYFKCFVFSFIYNLKMFSTFRFRQVTKMSGHFILTCSQSYKGFHEKGTFSVHSFNDDYLSIPERPGSYKYLFHEIPVRRTKKESKLSQIYTTVGRVYEDFFYWNCFREVRKTTKKWHMYFLWNTSSSSLYWDNTICWFKTQYSLNWCKGSHEKKFSLREAAKKKVLATKSRATKRGGGKCNNSPKLIEVIKVNWTYLYCMLM